PLSVESSSCIQTNLLAHGSQTRSTSSIGGSCPQLQTKSRTRPGSHRSVRLIGRQQTVQSSISDCSDCEVSICNGKTSPQCGQVTSVSTINCIVVRCSCRRLWRQGLQFFKICR